MICEHVSSQAPSPSAKFAFETLAIAAFGTIISAVFYTYMRQEVLRVDETYYYPLAEKILTGRYEDGYIVRPPLYPLFLAAVFKVFGTGFRPVLLVQSLIRGGLVSGASYIGMRYGFPLAGLVTAFLLAIYPSLVLTYSRFLSEAVYLPLFLLSFYMLDRALRTGRSTHMLVAGVTSGGAALARSTSFFLTVFLAGWIVVRQSKTGRFSRRNLINAGLVLAGLFAAVSPWMARNALVHGAFIPTGTSGAFNLYYITSGKPFHPSGKPFHQAMAEWSSWGAQPDRQKEGLRRWIRYLRGDPTFHLKQVIHYFGNRKGIFPELFGVPQWQPPKAGQKPIAAATPYRYRASVATIWNVVSPMCIWVILACGGLGLARFEKDTGRRDLMVAIIVFLLLFHTSTIARPRFFIPVAILLSIPAGRVVAVGIRKVGLAKSHHEL